MEKTKVKKPEMPGRSLTYEELAARVEKLEAALGEIGTETALSDPDEFKGLVDAGLMRRMLDNAPDLIWAKDLKDRYLFANKGICVKLLKCSSCREVIGKTDLFFARQERARGHEHTFGEICINSDQVVKESRKPGRFLEHGKVRGKLLVLDVHKSPFFDITGKIIGTVGCGRDITKEFEAQEALANASKELRNIVGDVDSIAVQGYDENRLVTLWNKASEQLYGYTSEEALGKKLEDLIIPEPMREEVIRAHERWLTYGERIPSGELVLKDKTGKDVYVYSSHSLQQTAAGKEMFCIDIDLAPIKKAEEEKRILYDQLEKAQKMEAIGTLASGIAHDFNNILSAITGYAELATHELPPDSSATGDLAMILQASRRATDLVRQILTFSRKTPQGAQPQLIRPVVEEAMTMMRSSIPSSIDISTDYAVENDMINADPTGVHQVVFNLCTNALHAMDNQKGQIRVTLDRRAVEREGREGEWETVSGSYIVLRVEDSGSGMDEKTREQIFEPYFTTKERGEGTGLGLAMVHGIVKRCGGFVEVESAPGKGTCFAVYFPVYQQESDDIKEVDSSGPLPVGCEHILYVDDEAALCHIIKTMLVSLGYRVTTETDSIAALENFKNDPSAYDLVISDQTMPQLTGMELAQKIFKLRKNTPFILCTGYSSAITERDVLNAGIHRYIEKPFSKRTLAQSIRDVLDLLGG